MPERQYVARIVLLLVTMLFLSSVPVGAVNGEAHYDYLKKVFNQHDDDLAKFLLAELASLERLYPNNAHLADAEYLIAQVYEEDGKEALSLFYLMRTVYLFPDATVMPSVIDWAHRIVETESRFKGKKADVKAILSAPPSFTKGENRHHAFLQFLIDLDEEKLYETTRAEMYEFLMRYPSSAHAEEVRRWLGDIYRLDDEEQAAVAAYSLYESLYPTSPHVPYVRNERARVVYEDLNEPEQAAAILTQVITDYPETAYAGDALYLRATIKADKLDDYQGAIADHRLLATKWPGHRYTVDALFQIADISESELKQYQSSVDTYNEIVRRFPQSARCVEALKESAEILDRKIKNPEQAAAQYARIGTEYPKHEEAVDALFKASDIAEDDMDNYNLAIDYLRIIQDQYPGSEASGKATKKIDDLREKLVEG